MLKSPYATHGHSRAANSSFSLLRSRRAAETGNHLVEDEQAVVARAHLAQALQERPANRHGSPMPAGRLQDHRADLRVGLQRLLDATEIIRRHGGAVLRDFVRYAGDV